MRRKAHDSFIHANRRGARFRLQSGRQLPLGVLLGKLVAYMQKKMYIPVIYTVWLEIAEKTCKNKQRRIKTLCKLRIE